MTCVGVKLIYIWLIFTNMVMVKIVVYLILHIICISNVLDHAYQNVILAFAYRFVFLKEKSSFIHQMPDSSHYMKYNYM